MYFLNYAFFVLTLLALCRCSFSDDFDMEDIQGDREKRTLILGVLFKKLLLQQAFARNMRMNSTTAMPVQEMMMDSVSNSQNPSQGPEQQPPASPPQMPQPPQTPAPPEPSSQGPPPLQSSPQGLRNPQAVAQGPPQGSPTQKLPPISQGFLPFNGFDPRQQTSLFPANYPFGIQRFRQLPFGPAPPLGAQAGPQSGARFPTNFPFNIKNGIFQTIPQRGSLISPPTNLSGLQSLARPRNIQIGPSQQSTGDTGTSQDQAPSIGLSEQNPPSGPDASGPGGDATEQLSQPPLQPNAGSQESPPLQSESELSGQSAPETQRGQDQGGETSPEQFGTNPSVSLPSQQPTSDGRTQGFTSNFPFRLGSAGPPPSQSSGVVGSQGSAPNFPFGPQQLTRPSNAQDTSPAQQGPLTNIRLQSLDNNLQEQFDPQLQEQLSANVPQSFPSPTGPQQPGQADNGFFDLRQFAGADNSVFDFSQRAQEGGPSPTGNSEQQQSPSEPFQNNFQNGLFSPTAQEQFSAANDPRTNFAFRGEQQGFSSPFQDSGNFQQNPFQQIFF